MQASLHETRLSGPAGSGKDAAEVRAHLEQILSSPSFKAAKGQSNFLRYVVEEALAGRADAIKEYSIGVEVFGRGQDFDPRISNIVRVEAQRLRSKLAKFYSGEGRKDMLRIELPKGGYTPVFLDNTAPPVTPDSVAAPAPGRSRGIRRWHLALGLAVAACVVFAAGWLTRRGRSSTENPSIAVLPFVNLSEHAEEEFVSDGLTDELIQSLGQVSGLHVVARTSAFQYKGKNIDVRKIGQELNVRTVLEGTVRQAGGRIRVSTELDDTTNGYRLWSRTFDREMKDVLVMQREISQAIVDALGIELAAGLQRAPRNAPNPAGARNPEAYRSYLKGVYFANKHTGETVQRAIAHFEEAIALDPDYAPAYVSLANCYSMIPSFTGIPTREIAAKWKAAARIGLELDDSVGQAHIRMGESYASEYDWPAAGREFKKGLELDPSDADGYRAYSRYLAKTGHLDLAIAAARKAVDLDPVSASASSALGKYLYQSRRFQDAIAQYRASLALDPNDGITHQGLGLVYLQKKMYSEGLAETEVSSRIMGGDPFITGQLGYAYAVSGNVGKAREVLSALLRRPDTKGVLALAAANIYDGLGEKDQVFEWLRKAVDQQDTSLFVPADPLYDTLRGDGRFTELLRRMKLL